MSIIFLIIFKSQQKEVQIHAYAFLWAYRPINRLAERPTELLATSTNKCKTVLTCSESQTSCLPNSCFVQPTVQNRYTFNLQKQRKAVNLHIWIAGICMFGILLDKWQTITTFSVNWGSCFNTCLKKTPLFSWMHTQTG